MNTTHSLPEKKQDYYEVAASWHDDILLTKDNHIRIYRTLCLGVT